MFNNLLSTHVSMTRESLKIRMWILGKLATQQRQQSPFYLWDESLVSETITNLSRRVQYKHDPYVRTIKHFKLVFHYCCLCSGAGHAASHSSQGMRSYSPMKMLKGLSHEIDFKTFDKNLQNLA
jgi:hypothetical protein